MGSHARRATEFFGLVVVLTAPFWILSAALHIQILPGLPIAALAVICPTLAAAILSFWHGGRTQLRSLLARALDYRKAGWWLLVIALINPALFGLAFLTSRFLGSNLPDPEVSVTRALALLALFLPAAVLEELGWSGYALDHLQARDRSPLLAALILGLFWAAWHYPALIQVGRSIEWMAWWSLWTVSVRVIMVSLYMRAGASVFAVALYHALSNMCWQLYPVSGSYFDPRISAVITSGLAVWMVWWGTKRPLQDQRDASGEAKRA